MRLQTPQARFIDLAEHGPGDAPAAEAAQHATTYASGAVTIWTRRPTTGG
jgi:hypothetical protein